MAHIVLLVMIGLVVLAAFVTGANLLARQAGVFDGARLFTWVWLASALVNAGVGVVYAKVPVVNEIAAFIPIFGVPAAVAWYLSSRVTARHRAD